MFNLTRAEKINYEFKVVDSNGDIHEQRYGTKDEKNFKYIENLHNTVGISTISLLNTSNKKHKINLVSLDLNNGLFLINDVPLYNNLGVLDKDINGNVFAVGMDKLELRPIYFRRIRVNSLNEREIKFALGFQTTYNKVNYKRYLLLDENGEYVVMCDK